MFARENERVKVIANGRAEKQLKVKVERMSGGVRKLNFKTMWNDILIASFILPLIYAKRKTTHAHTHTQPTSHTHKMGKDQREKRRF